MNKAVVKNILTFSAGVVATMFVYDNFLRDKIDPYMRQMIGK